MLVSEAQREVRTTYAGGFYGQMVSAVVWLASAGIGTWASPKSAMLTLVLCGFFIFPMTTWILALLGRPHSLNSDNPFKHLGWQLAMVLPLSMPLLAPITAFRPTWFFPAMMVLLGAHYLPFTTLYGMKSFTVLAALLSGLGIAIALLGPHIFAAGAWMTSIILFVFAFVGRFEAARAVGAFAMR